MAKETDGAGARKNFLVREAQPLKAVPAHTATMVQDARDWLEQVYQDCSTRRYDAGVLDRDRTGRVLVIDGDRGTGKTTVLLTLLELLEAGSKSILGTESSIAWPHHRQTKCILPVLDFDPLPHTMPVHGWLLAPWKQIADTYAQDKGIHEDLSEAWHTLFERAINGWTSVSVDAKPLVEKTLAFDEQVMGWREAQTLWVDFINMLCCAKADCATPGRCKKPHGELFVIPIDDVDLQVEHVVGLLHALRLFYHPNVAYILTADFEHIRFATELDYARRHLARMSPVRGREWNMLREIPNWSHRLADALLEKGMPEHARIPVGRLSLHHVSADKLLLANILEVREGVEPLTRTHLAQIPFTTWRRAEHASVRCQKRKDAGRVNSIKMLTGEFLIDLCEAMIDDSAPERVGVAATGEDSTSNVLVRTSFDGRLTTVAGRVMRYWGAETSIHLLARPRYKLKQSHEKAGTRGEDRIEDPHATRALVLYAAHEAELLEAPFLEWQPEHGILETHTEIGAPRGRPVRLPWPWVRPRIHELFQMQGLADTLARKWEEGSISSQEDLSFANLIRPWMTQVAAWLWARFSKDSVPDTLEATIAAIYKERPHDANQARIQDDATQWLYEMRLLAAPYFFLVPNERTALWTFLDKLHKHVQPVAPTPVKSLQEKLQYEEEKLLSTVLYASTIGRADQREKELDNLVKQFLRAWQKASDGDQWWRNWRGPLEKQDSHAGSGAKSDTNAD